MAQKLSERNTYTPTNTSLVRSNCDQSLNSLQEVVDSVSGLKTSDNNSEGTLTERGRSGQSLRVSVVYVLNLRGEPLMPTSPRKAKTLLKADKAKVIKRTPFTIQLLYSTGETTQDITLGVDPGYSKVGLSAITDKKELYSSEIQLRTNIVKLNSQRRMYRRNRRHRKIWHRKPRFLNRKKPKSWLAPSIQHKLDSHLKLIKEVQKILFISEIIVEVANFDIQKIQNPEISGKEYQQGDKYRFANVREYVFYRDGHKCRHCKGNSRDKILQVHHIVSRQIGGDRPENLLTVCKTCHDAHNRGETRIIAKPKKGFKAETFMNVINKRIINEIKELNFKTKSTFGYITKTNRIEKNLEKSHTNDAFIIANGQNQARASNSYLIKQISSNNRKLSRGINDQIKITVLRYIHGFQRCDKVLYNNQEYFILSRRLTGRFSLFKLDGTKPGWTATATNLKLLESKSTFLIEKVNTIKLLYGDNYEKY